MPVKRIDRRVLRNREELYSKVFQNRGVKFVDQYETPYMVHPNDFDVSSLTTINHIWQLGDRYYKLASQYYGEPEYWWVIAWYNQLPTESHIELGDIVIIPTPVEDAIQILKEGTSK
jgi:nucleoid-associated protein YgaU